MKLIKSTVLALAIITAFAPVADVQAADIDRREMAVIEKAEAWQELAFLLAPIKTREDLDRYMEELRQNPDAKSPLNLLSSAARDRFVNSLVFTERGLGGYYYGDLQSQLTASQIYRLLSLFGAQHTTSFVRGARIESRADQLIMQSDAFLRAAPDHENYECVSRATCGPRTNYICTSNC